MRTVAVNDSSSLADAVLAGRPFISQPGFDQAIPKSTLAGTLVDLDQAGTFPVPLPPMSTVPCLQIAVAEFHFIEARILEFEFKHEATTGTLFVKAAIDTHTIAVLEIMGRLLKEGAEFKPEAVSLKLDLTADRARADFVTSSLTAMLGLAEEVHLSIPEIALHVRLRFALSLLECSRMLLRRQTAHRLMVIERATGVEFLLPPYFSGDEITTMLLMYRAITERSFIWPLETYPLHILANEDYFHLITNLPQPTPLTFIREQVSETLLGKVIPFGKMTVTIADGIIENADALNREFARLDGHHVILMIRSLTGQARIELPEAPRLPQPPWDSTIQPLIDLESQLDARLAAGYHALAAATLEGLTEEEKAEVTAGIEMDEFFDE